jgi:copper chaperone CopZ
MFILLDIIHDLLTCLNDFNAVNVELQTVDGCKDIFPEVCGMEQESYPANTTIKLAKASIGSEYDDQACESEYWQLQDLPPPSLPP